MRVESLQYTERLFDDLWVKDLPGVERDHNSICSALVNPMAALRSQKRESRLQEPRL